MKISNNMGLNASKSPSFRANAVDIFKPGLTELGQEVRRTDLTKIAESAKSDLLKIPGVDLFEINRNSYMINNSIILDPTTGMLIPTGSLPMIIPTDDISITATKTFQGPNQPRKGFFGFFARLLDYFIYPKTVRIPKNIPALDATVERLTQAGREAAAELN